MTKLNLKFDIHFYANRFRHSFFSKLLLLFVWTILICSFSVLSQTKEVEKTCWLYVITEVGGVKMYFRSDTEKLKNGYIRSWSKRIYTDGTSAIYLADWDCENNRFYNYEVTGYDINGYSIVHQKLSGWNTAVADSAGEKILNRICGTEDLKSFAEIKTLKANLRLDASVQSPIIRVAEKGEQFRIVFVTPDKTWYNVVDEETQEDYWLHRSTIDIFKNP